MGTQASPESSVELAPLSIDADLAALAGSHLSAWFDRFLPSFARETVAVGGEAWGAWRGDRLDGVLLFLPFERAGSAFVRSAADLGPMGARFAPVDLYLEHPVPGVRETLDVLRFDLTRARSRGGLRHVVRLASPRELDDLARLADRPAEERRWADALRASGAVACVAELDGRIVGAAWAGRIGPLGRVHSLYVHPRYRRLGIGADLLEVRLRWLGSEGAREVLTEISVDNAPSLAIARHAGGFPIGRMYRARWERPA